MGTDHNRFDWKYSAKRGFTFCWLPHCLSVLLGRLLWDGLREPALTLGASPPPCDCGFATHRRLRAVSGILPSAIFFGASCPGAPARRRNGPVVTVGKRLSDRPLSSSVEFVLCTSLPVAARLRCGRWAGYAGPRLTGIARSWVMQTGYDRSGLLWFKPSSLWPASLPDASDAIQAPRPSRRRPSMDRRALRSWVRGRRRVAASCRGCDDRPGHRRSA